MKELKRWFGIKRYEDQKTVNTNAGQHSLEHYILWRFPLGLVISYSYKDLGKITSIFGKAMEYEHFRVGIMTRRRVDNWI